MINLGRTSRWAGRPGAVERAVKALKRRGGVRAEHYVCHLAIGERTLCGREAAKVNCAPMTEAGREYICRRCAAKAVDGTVDKESRTSEKQAPAPGLEPGSLATIPDETAETGGKSGL